jgi:type II/III secretion system protein
MSTFAFRVASGVLVGSIGLLCGDALSSGGGSSERTLHTIPLKHAVAPELSGTIAPLAPPGGRILADARSNSLIIDATPDDFAKIRDLVATVDVLVPESSTERGAKASAAEPSASVNVAIVEMTPQKAAELGIRVGDLGSTGLAEGPARTIADLADRGGESSVVVHTNATMPLSFGRRTHLSRSYQQPIPSGGVVPAENSLDVVAQPNGGEGAMLEVQYQIQKLASGAQQPPTKSAQQGVLQLALRSGDLAVTGGRLSGDADANMLFVVVRLAVRK